MDKDFNYEEMLGRLSKELDEHIEELHQKIQEYGSFNIIANSIVKNQIRDVNHYKDYEPETLPIVPEYLALICLKFPYSLGTREFTHARDVAKDLYEINKLAIQTIGKYSFVHHGKYHKEERAKNFSNLSDISRLVSSQELFVRNPTFESFHWDLLEELYGEYNAFFLDILGFTVEDSIDVCISISDYVSEQIVGSIKRAQENSTQMYQEIIAFKYRNKIPKNFYPDEYLKHYKKMRDVDIKRDFQQSMMTYEMVMMGHTLSFTCKEISKKTEIDERVVQKFLDKLSIRFGEINPDFRRPEIIHPLKDRPLIQHEGRYLCPSNSLLDYSLDRLFSDTLLKDSKKREKYKEYRHDYLLQKGMSYITDCLKSKNTYTNLNFPNGEMDGLIFCNSNIFFIEAKGHKFSDRAKKGFIDRIETHINDIILGSYNQALKAYNYLFGKKDVVFTDKSGKKIILDGSGYQNAYFISLTLEDLSTISCSLKVNNSMGLFTKETFPWIVSLYDLRAVCEHMEGPAYFVQYLHRRREFFNYDKFLLNDELDLLGYYLKRNLRFDEMLEKTYKRSDYIYLESLSDEFNRYYLHEQGYSKKPHPKMKHYSIQPIKSLVKALEDSGLSYGIDAGVQILELSSKTKKELLNYISKIKKQFKKDSDNHDFRIGGDDIDGRTWMFSYWVGPKEKQFIEYFDYWVHKKFRDDPVNKYIAILDTGKNSYEITRIVHLQTN